MKYFFHVRPWTLGFFTALEKILVKKSEVELVFLTMNIQCFEKLQNGNREVYYLPSEFEKTKINNRNEKEEVLKWDKLMFEKFGFGFNHLYQMERFKPSANLKEVFIFSQVKWLIDNIPAGSKIVSLSCDHFVYILSMFINKIKNGNNYFIQPVGFPQDANIILDTPFSLRLLRNSSMDEKLLHKYIEDLSRHPSEVIHYMKSPKNPPLYQTVWKRIKDFINTPSDNSIFKYLEIVKTNFIPERWKKNEIPIDLKYLQLNDVKELSKNVNVFYFPLQYEPEMSILAFSPYFQDQIEVARLITQSLRQQDILILKENPKMIGKRERSFYKKISSLGNIAWADPSLNSRELIKNSFKTVSITGTATIEAACMGRNSIIFGYPPFRNLLLEKTIAEQKISNFTDILYKNYDKKMILEKVWAEWDLFSKSLFIGDFIPRFCKGQYTIPDSESLAKDFIQYLD